MSRLHILNSNLIYSDWKKTNQLNVVGSFLWNRMQVQRLVNCDPKPQTTAELLPSSFNLLHQFMTCLKKYNCKQKLLQQMEIFSISF